MYIVDDGAIIVLGRLRPIHAFEFYRVVRS